MKKAMKIIYLSLIVLLGTASISWASPTKRGHTPELKTTPFITDNLSVSDVLDFDIPNIEKKGW